MRYLLTMSAHNEANSIHSVISEFIAEAKRLGISLKVHVIDDNSHDSTYRAVSNLGIPIFRLDIGNGLAQAFRKEMEVALKTDADYYIHIDADGQHSADDLIKFIAKVSEGYDLILGNRLHVRPIEMSILRYYGNVILSKIVSFFSNQIISDSQTGYRLMHRELTNYCKCTTGNYTYTQEQIIRAATHNFRICEVPISIRPRRNGRSRLARNPLYYMFRVLIDLIKLVYELRLFNRNLSNIYNFRCVKKYP